MVIEKKRKPETGAVFDECPKCHDRVNKTWISNGSCCYCKMNNHEDLYS